MSPPPREPEDVLRDLLYLRKASGFNATRFKRTPALRAVLGGDGEPFEVLHERFVSAITSLNDADAELLMRVYGLETDASALPDLQSRRDFVAKQLGIGRDAVADRDGAAVNRLQYQLMTGWYPKSPVSLRIPESHNGVVNHFIQVTTLVRNRRHIDSQHHYRFFCTFDGAGYIAFTTAPGVPVTVIGDAFRLTTNEVESGLLHRFWHSTPMVRGRAYDLQFRVDNPNPDESGWLTEESLAFHEPTRFATFRTMFIGESPEAIWKFSGLTGHERPGEPLPRNLLKIERFSAGAEFRDLYGGQFAGIAWHWQTRKQV